MRFSIQHGLTACNVRLSGACVAGHAPKLTINGTAFTLATVRIVGYSEVIQIATWEHYWEVGKADSIRLAW